MAEGYTPNLTVDYKALFEAGSKIRANGEAIEVKVKDVYSRVQNMHSVWFGQRYNALVKSFNEIVQPLNQLFTIVESQLPEAMQKAANNYAQADTGANVGTISAGGNAGGLAEIPQSTSDVGLKFDATQVETAKGEILNLIGKTEDNGDSTILGLINNIETIQKSVTWTSVGGGAAEAFVSKFNTLKGNIFNSFSGIKTQFESLMAQTLDDITQAEKNSTVQ